MQAEILEEARKMLSTELQQRGINPIFLPIVNMYLEDKPLEEIADTLGLDPMEVSIVLEKHEIKNYINQIISSVGYLNRLRRIKLINKVIDDFVDRADEYEAPLTKKDLLDWLKLLQEESKMYSKPESPRTAVQINQNGKANMVSLVEELLE